MKTIKFSLLSLILSLAFVACSKDKKDTPGDDDKGPATSTFFTIENATYHETGNLPQGSTELINDLTINRTVINGGSTVISFTSPQQIKTAYVAVKGMPGYYEYNFDESNSSLRSSSYYYELILFISQLLTEEQDFIITISVLAANGDRSRPVDTDEIQIKEVGTGTLQVSLSWDQLDDVDLHLLEPSGNKIYYGNRSSENWEKLEFEFGCYLVEKYTSHDVSSLKYTNENDWYTLDEYLEDVPYLAYLTDYEPFMTERRGEEGGYLDLDSNPGCSIDGVNNENITYKNAPAAGTYYVAVDLFEKCNSSKAGAKYSVTVNYKGQAVTISNKQTGQFEASDGGSYNKSSQYHVIGGFTIDASGIRPATVTGNPFESYDNWGWDDDDYGVALRKASANFKTRLFKK